MHHLYVLRSKKDDKLYIGTTGNLKKRLEQHNNGHVKSTCWRQPLVLVYKENYQTLHEARKREWILKCTPGGGKELKKILKEPGWRSSR